MKFTRLKLHGFKSFCDETTLVMEPGLTGIVGPNGCGKSNLVEAMRWVMGESSYKAMRASGMDDVIFSGSGSRPARNTAEVTLVLDNSDRTAPAALNNADVLEVTRRIEREAGSVYRVNGREVRARDVQLLFADASTGAHSPALVRQGQIGELIAAKPVQRRALLEEAAGISGLHSRRHEAELRLRAAEGNLERVDDVIAQVEAQLETLKRQARLATRYRALSGDIRRAEATLAHLRWVAARFAEKEAEAQQAVLTRRLADATTAERQAQKALEAAAEELVPLKEREAVTGAVLQRYTILAEQLTDEARRIAQRREEFESRLRQVAADGNRERELIAEADAALVALKEEDAQLAAEAEAAAADLDAARAATEEAKAATAEAEAKAREALNALAQLRARRAAAERSHADAAARVERLRRELTAVEAEHERVSATNEAEDRLLGSLDALETARAAAAMAEAMAVASEEETAAAQERFDLARPRLNDVESALTRLEAEAATLSRMLGDTATEWPSIVDELKVWPGYETALGAALGDDLEASADLEAPVHWSDPIDHRDDPALPQAAEPLSRYVTGSPLLKRRLDQVGIVSSVDGPALMSSLKPGQRLVTVEGDMWRWDGFVAAADAPSRAAQRLTQRNRLAEIVEEIAQLQGERNSRRRDVVTASTDLEEARRVERQRRDGWRAAQHAIATAQAAVDEAQRQANDLVARQSAVAEARQRLRASLEEAEAVLAETAAAADSVGTEAEAEAAAGALEVRLASRREAAERARLQLSALDTAARVRDARRTQLARDIESWQRRRAGAAAQLSTLADRTREIHAQLAQSAETPDGYAGRKAKLEEQIETARIEHKAATDALATADTRWREADRATRAAGEALTNARVELTRVEERVRGFIAQRLQIEKTIEESLGIPATQTLEVSGIKPMEALPAENAVEQKLERLRAERERLGGVNLSAEKEATEVGEKLDAMVRDRDELIEAIAKLRTGIQSLNKEGRARLNEAFTKVNAHFQELFTTLFGGGTAELSFVESDDPLEAGLEIIARPPGKKPQTMTLLSGGEQALTAMSLIFAVFLTNPAPICVLDEVDAPLDDANVERFCNLLDSMRQRTNTRFMVITHNPITMSRVDRLFGVTMAERGVSQLVSVDLTTAESFREAV